MRNIQIFLLTTGLFLAACSPAAQVKSREQVTPALDESFDPLTLNDDDLKPEDIQLHPREMKKPEQAPQENRAQREFMNLEETDGFRVQLFAGKEYDKANFIKSEIAAKFPDYGQQIYLTFETPWYKIRVGNFRVREKADEFRDLARSAGFDQSFVVQSKVLRIDQPLN